MKGIRMEGPKNGFVQRNIRRCINGQGGQVLCWKCLGVVFNEALVGNLLKGLQKVGGAQKGKKMYRGKRVWLRVLGRRTLERGGGLWTSRFSKGGVQMSGRREDSCEG